MWNIINNNKSNRGYLHIRPKHLIHYDRHESSKLLIYIRVKKIYNVITLLQCGIYNI